jgi:DNA-binding FadR family transcriptional regulator
MRARLYESIAADLAAKITAGEYLVGRRLPSERDLAQAYQVSRPTVREAIIALEIDGLVEVRLGSGVYVLADAPSGGERSATDVGPFELLEARRAIESEICAVAALRITAAELATLEELLAEMNAENGRDLVRAEDADRRFHLTIAAATQNGVLVDTMEALWDARARSPQTRLLSNKAQAAGVAPKHDEHRKIIDALSSADPSAARAAMRHHLSRVIHSLIEATEVHELEEARARVAATRDRYVG